MLSERGLARSHTSLWLNCAPRLNAQLMSQLDQMPSEQGPVHRWALPYVAQAPFSHNDVIAEVAFGMFNFLIENKSQSIRVINDAQIDKIIKLAIQQLSIIRGGPGFPREWFSQDHLEDATQLSSRLFEKLIIDPGHIMVHPRLEGLGILMSCHPDIIQGKQLIEVKMSRYPFRSQDLRQLIIYAMLAWFQGIELDFLTLINPRLGVSWQFSNENLAFLVSNDPPVILFQKLQEYLTGETIDRWV